MSKATALASPFSAATVKARIAIRKKKLGIERVVRVIGEVGVGITLNHRKTFGHALVHALA